MVFCCGFKNGLNMARRKKTDKSFAKLLDEWTPPDGAGDPIGCVSTSFTFSPVFFEEECLGRFLQLQSDASEDGPVYIIEREEKMAEIQCIAALVDSSHCKGDRSLRWDLLAARIPQAILHCKISLLYWQNLIRIIIGSANLTEDGYRRNQEIYGVVDYRHGNDTSIEFLEDIIGYLKEVGGYAFPGEKKASPVTERWNQFLDSVGVQASFWIGKKTVLKRSAPRLAAILTGPGRKDALSQITSFWPSNVSPEIAVITSPFFDPPGSPNLPAKKLWETLKKRGKASAIFNIAGSWEPDCKSLVLHAPEEILAATPQGRKDVETRIQLIEEREKESDSPLRPLHLKSYLFQGSGWLGYMIGSGNFTSKGLGFVDRSNFEANILYLVPQDSNPKAVKQLMQSVPNGLPIKKDVSLIWQPPDDADQDSPGEHTVGLHNAFGQAVYKNDQYAQYVEFHFNDTPPSGWIIFRRIDSDEVLYDFKKWERAKRPNPLVLDWKEDTPPSGFEILWDELGKRAWWPVNVDKATSLPPPSDLKDLPLEILVNILTSARPLHLVIAAWKKKDENDNSDNIDPFNPHNRVDTSGFILKKTYRVTSALAGLRKRLERPAPSEDALQWRISGPIGVNAVANAISKEAKTDEEKAFLLTELALEISRIQPSTAPGCLPNEMIIDELRKVIHQLKDRIADCKLKKSGNINKYIDFAFKEALL